MNLHECQLSTQDLLRLLAGDITALTAKPVAGTPSNARRMDEVACLLTSALGLLNEATDTDALVACRYQSCGEDHCSMLTREQCLRCSGNPSEGTCGSLSGPGLDTAIRAAGGATHKAKQ